MSNISLAVSVGLICALLSALATNLAFLFKHRGAVAAPDVEMRHPLRSAIDLFHSRWWSIGWAWRRWRSRCTLPRSAWPPCWSSALSSATVCRRGDVQRSSGRRSPQPHRSPMIPVAC
jgi:hypothetical protein